MRSLYFTLLHLFQQLLPGSSSCKGEDPSIKRHVPFLLKRLFLGLKSHLHLAQRPSSDKYYHGTGKDDQRFSKSARERRIVRDDKLAVSELVDQVSRLDADSCSTDSIEVGSGQINRGRYDG
jgi:hypothetical protein